MRPLEVILFAGVILLWLAVLFIPRLNRKVGWVIGGICFIALVVQWLVEGYRWQLVPAYFSLLLLTAAVALKRPGTPQQGNWRRKAGKFLLLAVSGIVILVSAALAVLLPVFRLPEPDGIYAVGTESFMFVDPQRMETYTEKPDDHRTLMVTIWYPAERAATGKRAMLLPQSGAKGMEKRFLSTYSEAMGLPDFALYYWKYLRGNSYEKAEIASTGTAPYPIILLSHGLGTTRMLHTSQAENLASQGYVVAAIDHTYSTTATVFPDGEVTGFQAKMDGDDFLKSGKELGETWAADVDYVIECLERFNQGENPGRFKGRLDVSKIGALGHSFGGATAYHLAATRDKIKAGINMDGTNYDVFDKDQILTKPFLFMESGAFKSFIQGNGLDGEGSEPERMREIINNEKSIIGSARQHNGHFIYIEGSEHYNFTDLPLYSPLVSLTGMTGTLEANRGAGIVNDYVLDFFDTYLKGKKSALLAENVDIYPEVKRDLEFTPTE